VANSRLGNGIPRSLQILAASQSSISVCRGTVVFLFCVGLW
jgi:hypothetical protein